MCVTLIIIFRLAAIFSKQTNSLPRPNACIFSVIYILWYTCMHKCLVPPDVLLVAYSHMWCLARSAKIQVVPMAQVGFHH